MASGSEVLPNDLPRELFEAPIEASNVQQENSWQSHLQSWAQSALNSGETELLSQALPEFEKILLSTALAHTNGHKQDAAKLLGWGRNTLTRKLKELSM
jgi:two-component system nitrogen regulation response regulator GlnG